MRNKAQESEKIRMQNNLNRVRSLDLQFLNGHLTGQKLESWFELRFPALAESALLLKEEEVFPFIRDKEAFRGFFFGAGNEATAREIVLKIPESSLPNSAVA